MLLPRVLILIIFLLVSVHLKAQDTEIGFLKDQIHRSLHSPEESLPMQTATPGNRLILNPVSLSFVFYRKVISEQISADCAFDLSCSRFSIKAIKNVGLFKGVLLTADRLTRCHTFISADTAPILFNNKTGRVIDEPDMY
jgi:putative component of membrane protein insertase Oxa1/YidC/SpoIIIJ protein YidD